MRKNIVILLVAALVIALPFVFRQPRSVGTWKEGDPVLVVISPHIASIRDEFEHGFSEWHLARYGRPVRIDWRNVGGTTEIMRYLQAELDASFRAWWSQTGHDSPPDSEEAQAALRATDDPAAFTTKIDVFFGGGTYDHGSAARHGLTARIWPEGKEPVGILRDAAGRETFPEGRGGEQWRDGVYYSAVLSSFGICYNFDRLRDLGIDTPPSRWGDLTDPRLFGQVGVTDPTKSGSIAKAFEMIVHSECLRAVHEAGFSREDIRRNEAMIADAQGIVPQELAEYQAAVERGWREGVALLQAIGANARYFTDGASKVAIDVSSGDAAAGVSIDFYARVQAEVTRSPEGKERMGYVTPAGGSSVSGDPISVIRGAPHRELSERFVQFVLSPEGQRLWNYRVGEPGGPVKYSLRRMPVLREFYPEGMAPYTADDPAAAALPLEHAAHTADNLTLPEVDAYALSGSFDYVGRWTGRHFAFFRLLVRAMCMDAGPELKDAWLAIREAGGEERCPEAVAALRRLPPGLNWASAPGIVSRASKAKASNPDEKTLMDLSREWTLFFRASYTEAAALARAASGHSR